MADKILVSALGFGRDIWTIPFNNVTTIIKVGPNHALHKQSVDSHPRSLSLSLSKALTSEGGGQIIQYVWLTEIMYMMTLGLTKIAILAFYLKVFPNEGFRRVCWTTAAVCLCSFPAFSIFTIFYCTPVSYTWEGWTGEVAGHCLSFNKFAWIQTSINIVLDTFILVLPLPLVWRLNMGRRKRVLLMLMFSVGVLYVS